MPSVAVKPKKSKKSSSGADEAQAMTVQDLMKMVNGRKGWEGAVILGNDPSLEIKRIPTGIFALDEMLGGGFARDRHAELFGPPGCGKTSIVYRAIANAQKLYPNELCAFLDIEQTFDPKHAKALGVDLKKLVLHRQKHGNRAIDFMELLTRTENFSIIAMDSIAALMPLSEMEADMEAGSYGTAQAKLMSAALRRLTSANKHTALLYINQQRENIGGGMFAKKFVTSGGKAMAFYAGVRLELVKTESIKVKTKGIKEDTGADSERQKIVGHRVLVRGEKDKTGGMVGQGDQTTLVYDYRYDNGPKLTRGNFDEVEDVLYLGRVTGLIKKNGSSWWIDGEEERFKGRPAMKKYLKAHPSIVGDLKEEIHEALRGLVDDDAEETDDAE
jgi:recombination protein RecA